jgi:two-component system CheB/CheR fusion protein
MHVLDASPVLSAAARALDSARDLPTITAVVRRAARELTGADGVTFVLREGDCCHCVDEDAIAPLWKGQRFSMDACISGWVMLNHQPAIIPDIYADARIPHEAYRPTFVRSLAMMPVRTSEPIGAIGAYWATPHQATAEEVDLLHRLADHAALALENIGLRRALASKDEHVASVTHELRQPLQAATAAVALLRRQSNDDAAQPSFAVLERQLRQMARMIDDLLEATRIVRGGASPTKAIVDVREVVRGAIETVASAIDERQHELMTSLPAEPVLLDVDAGRLQQVLVNLLSNAVKYTPQGGRIRLAVQPDASHVTIRVCDSGIGLAASELVRIFDPFVRADGAGERGFGIGLSVARRLVELHDGTIEARSDGHGRGSEFIVRLPFRPRDASLRQIA